MSGKGINYTSFNEIRRRLLNAKDIEHSKLLLQPLFQGYQLYSYFIYSGARFYRGRIIKDKPLFINDFSYNKNIDKVAKGRCNRENIPVFYASTMKEMVLLELKDLKVYLATAPKSNSVYVASKAALAMAKEYGSLMPPKHILNAQTKLMKNEGYGKDYRYDHDVEDGFSGQNYFPDKIPRTKIYNPVERGFEREIIKRLDY